MAKTIYKTEYHVNRNGTGTILISSGYGDGTGGTVDLSNYYTIPQLQTAGLSQVNFANITNAYHNHLLGLEGGETRSDDSSGTAGEYYHLSGYDYYRVILMNFTDSIVEESDNIVHLDGDVSNPGLSMYYGTNIAGIKGWYSSEAENTLPFQIADYESSGDTIIDIDVTTYKDWIIPEIYANVTININNSSDGDAGQLEIIIDSSGGYTITLGTMFTKQLGATDLVVTAGADNILSWRNVLGTDIVYTIGQIV